MVSILGANSVSGGYEVSNSLRFNDDDSPLLTRAISTNPSDQKLTTISFWFKIGNITSAFRALYRFNDGSNTGAIYLRSGDDLQFAWDVSSGSLDVRPDGLFRDPSAWYHCHIKVDTTQGTAANRVIIHINGVERSYGTATYPNQNATLQHLSNGKTYYIGGSPPNSDYYFDGYVTEFHVIDGQAKDYTDFGEFDDNGVWIPKKYTGSYGTNGFYLQFKQTGTSQNASGIGADTSGNGNHFAVSNLAATDITEDTCQNNFCTLNPLYKQGSPAFSEGNCKVVLPAGDGTQGAAGGIAPANGKWYWEVKHVSSTQSSILVREASDREDYLSYYEGNYAGYEKLDGNQRVTGNTESTYGAAYANGDIVMVALDMDNDRVYFGKNGSWNDGSGNADEANLNDYVSLSGVVNGLAAVANGNGSATATFEMNFGNPSFAISSSNADANGYGNFEYSVPSGYYALCTKNLAEFG